MVDCKHVLGNVLLADVSTLIHQGDELYEALKAHSKKYGPASVGGEAKYTDKGGWVAEINLVLDDGRSVVGKVTTKCMECGNDPNEEKAHARKVLAELESFEEEMEA